MKPLSEEEPRLLAFTSRSNQCDVKVSKMHKTYKEPLEVLGPIYNQIIIPFLIPGCSWKVILHKEMKNIWQQKVQQAGCLKFLAKV